MSDNPCESLVACMQRIYDAGLTTTSGGNLSLRDAADAVWITPAGLDKGCLRPADIVRVGPDDVAAPGPAPSSEYPFHRALYRARPDLRAIVHAHPPALVAYSLAHQVPDVRLLPDVAALCGPVGYAAYAIPGSQALAAKVAAAFAGHASVLLENHGIVAGGADLSTAFARFEALEFAATALLHARTLLAGSELPPPPAALPAPPDLTEADAPAPDPREQQVRNDVCAIARRACIQRLTPAAGGSFSARLDAHSFVITPRLADRRTLAPDDLVRITAGQRERGKFPDPTAALHAALYARQPEIAAVLNAPTPAATGYALSGRAFDTRTIPESYIVLRGVIHAPYPALADGTLAAEIGPRTPVALIRHSGVLATGASLHQAFDRLEVTEFSAAALLHTVPLGPLVPIAPQDLAEIERVFRLG